jgi:hypothetical protein
METVTAVAKSAVPEFDLELLSGTKKLNAATVHYEAVNGQFVEEAASQPRLTDSAWKIPEHVDLEQVVSVCEDMDGEALGEIFEKNWSPTMKETNLLVRIAKEMKRKFRLIKGKRDVHGKPLTIRGCTSFKGWFPKATGKSFQYGYYLLKDKGSSSSRTPSRPPCSSDQAAETLARTYYVIRRKSDGSYWYEGWNFFPTAKQLGHDIDPSDATRFNSATSQEAKDAWKKMLKGILKLGKSEGEVKHVYDPADYGFARVEMTLKVTPVEQQPSPDPETEKDEKKTHRMKKVSATQHPKKEVQQIYDASIAPGTVAMLDYGDRSPAEPTNPKPRARKKKETSPAAMVNVDELPPEACARVMAQIEPSIST